MFQIPGTNSVRQRSGDFLVAFVIVAMVAALLGFVAPAPRVDAQAPPPTVVMAPVAGASGAPVEDGTAVFGGYGNCPADADGDSDGDGNPELPGEVGYAAQMAPPVPIPGEDCHFDDNVVRTNDAVSYGFSIGVNNLTGDESMDNVMFTQTITPGAGADVSFTSMPTACQTGTAPAEPDGNGLAYAPQSSITTNPDGSITLVCNIGRLNGPSETVFLKTNVKAESTSDNGSSFDSTTTICADPDGVATGCDPNTDDPDDVTTAVHNVPDETSYISAAPRYDLAKNKRGPSGGNPYLNTKGDADDSNDELGFYYLYYLTIEADAAGDGKGQEALAGDLTFNDIAYVDGTTTPVPGMLLMDFTNTGGALTPCNPNTVRTNIPYGRVGITGASDATNSVPNTGTTTCTQAGPGAPIDITLSGTDTSGTQYPDFSANNATALTPPYYIASMWVRIWYPFESVDRYDPAAVCDADDTAAGYSAPFCGDVDGNGDLPVQNCVGGFAPTSGQGVPNYLGDPEPGEYGSGTAGTNNCRLTSMRLTTRGSYAKYYSEEFHSYGNIRRYLPGQTASHTGDGPIEPEQSHSSVQYLTNNGTTPMNNVVTCDNVDNMTQSLSPIPFSWYTGTQPVRAVLQVNGQTNNLITSDTSPDIIVEYASGPAGTPATGHVNWDNDHLAGGPGLGGQYTNATYAQQKATPCTDANGNWTTDPYSFDADPDASLQKIRSVRVRLVNGLTLNPSDRLLTDIHYTTNNTFFGGPNDGVLIPAGVIVPNYSAWRSDEIHQDFLFSYDSNTDAGGYGDRLIFSRGYVRLEKATIPEGIDVDNVTNADLNSVSVVDAGDPIWFRLQPAVISNGPAPQPMTDVIVTDVLPGYLEYDPACTASIIKYPLPIVQNDTPNAGETTLIWNLGTVPANTQLDPIDFCTISDQLAPDGADALNTAVIEAAEDASPEAQRDASATVKLTQLGGFRVRKIVDDKVDPIGNNQNWRLRFANMSDFVILDPPNLIDIFPHNDDALGEGSLAERNPGSEITGTIELQGAPTSSVPGVTWYTKRAPISINPDPTDGSNPTPGTADGADDGIGLAGTTMWCLVGDFTNPDCPADFSEVTSIHWRATDPLQPGDLEQVDFELLAIGNAPGDRYANIFHAETPTLPGQLSKSNNPRVWIAGVTVGDFVWFDWDDDGTYDPSQGETPVPDGVTINLYNDGTGALVDTTTTVNGRYVFQSLPDGTYSIEIPASEFAGGALLETMVPSTPVGVPDDDLNESIDQHGYVVGGAVVTDGVFAAAGTTPGTRGNIIVDGQEPLGEDVAAIDLDTPLDSLSNLTLDIGLHGPPAIELIKKVNDDDANTTTGPVIALGDDVTWTFEITNTGDVDLINVELNDNLVDNSTIVCPTVEDDDDGDNIIAILRRGETVICSVDAPAGAVGGQYTNTADVEATDPAGTTTVEDDDPANYFGATTGVSIKKFTNGIDADDPNGPLIEVGDPVTWTYVVQNTGNVDLEDVAVTDDIIAAADIDCGGGSNIIPLLRPGGANLVVCVATGVAVADQYANTGTVADGVPLDEDGDPIPGLDSPEDDDDSHYFGVEPSVDVEKTTNTVDADTPAGPLAEAGSTVTWEYTVVNDGNVPLTDVTLVDTPAPASGITCADHMADTDGDNVIDLMLPGAEVVCSAAGTAVEGQYTNNAEVSGNPVFPSDDGDYDPADPDTWPTDPADYADIPNVDDPEAEDPSHYFGWTGTPGIDIEKATNTFDADNPAGPFVIEGGGVSWTYRVENTGDLPLLAVAVTDNVVAASAISCAVHLDDTDLDNVIDVLLPNDVVVCTANGTAIVNAPDGQYANTGSATGGPAFPTNPGAGFDPDDPATYPSDPADYTDLDGVTDPTDSDDSHYFSATPDDPAVDVEKDTNGDDADDTTGPYLTPGTDLVTWTFEVRNSGGYTLVDVEILDDQLAAGDLTCGDLHDDTDGDNIIDLMLPNDTVTCTASATADTVGQYANVVTVTGDPVVPENCDSCDPDDPSTWPTDPSEYVPAEDPAGDPLSPASESDPSHYFGVEPAVDVEKATNGQDADDPTGPFVAEGDTVTWTYVVENTGNVALTGVALADSDPAVTITCPVSTGNPEGDTTIELLLPEEVVTCTATAAAVANLQYSNTATVSGQPALPTSPGPDFDASDPDSYPTDPSGYDDITTPAGDPLDEVDDADDSHYVGTGGGLDLEKATNTVDADTPTGPALSPGDTVTWAYTVTNNSNTALAAVTVTDVPAPDGGIDCGDGTNVIALLVPGAEVVCTATGTAVAGQFANDAAVTGQPSFPTNPGPDFDPSDPDTYPTDPTAYGPTIDPDTGLPVPPQTDEDPSHYYGVVSDVDVEKATNGEDADDPTGPFIVAGDTVTWDYVVQNTGNVALTDAVLTDDDPSVVITCPVTGANPEGDNTFSLLLPGEIVNCTASAPAIGSLQYANTATITGTPSFPTAPGPDYDPADPATYPTDPTEYVDIPDPVTGDPLPNPEDTDDSHYVGTDSGLDLEKATNSVDADNPTGPAIAPGEVITWTYTVTNNSNSALTGVTVTDVPAPDGGIDCGDGTNVIALLLPDASVVCTATGTAVVGQFANNASVTGQPSFPTTPGPDFDPEDPSTYPTDPSAYGPTIDPDTGLPVPPQDDDDPSHYFGAEPGVEVIKYVNGEDANVEPGLQIDVGEPITWTYDVTNTGNTVLINVDVADDQGVVVTCPSSILLPGATMTCEGSGVAVAGDYVNIGTVTGDPSLPIDPGPTFDPEDPSTYPPDPSIDPEDPTTWPTDPGFDPEDPSTYPPDPSVDPTDPNTWPPYVPPFDPTDPTTWPTDPELYVPGTDPEGEPLPPVTDDDPARHFGNGPGIELVKDVCVLEEADDCDPTDDAHWGQSTQAIDGQDIQWRLTVINTGNVDLSGVTVVDATVPSCNVTIGRLAVEDTYTHICRFRSDGSAILNTAVASGTGPSGTTVDDDDDAEVTPSAELALTKAVSDAAPENGDVVTYTVNVTNNGPGVAPGATVVDTMPDGLEFDATQTADAVYDAATHTITWTLGEMAVGETMAMVYTATVNAGAGESLLNIASVTCDCPETLVSNNTSEVPIEIPTPPGRLAFTGSTIWGIVRFATVLLGLGLMLVLVSRRRRSTS
jgi:uncharacterized repeat protein (TIGR01451 family)